MHAKQESDVCRENDKYDTQFFVSAQRFFYIDDVRRDEIFSYAPQLHLSTKMLQHDSISISLVNVAKNNTKFICICYLSDNRRQKPPLVSN